MNTAVAPRDPGNHMESWHLRSLSVLTEHVVLMRQSSQ